MKKIVAVLLVLCMTLTFLAAVAEETAPAATVFETADGVLSIKAPNEEWTVFSDPNYWFAMTDGDDVITISHLSNGEALPAAMVANEEYAAICQAYVSTENEVFVIKGCSATKEGLKDIMIALSTVQILKFDTKQAIQKVIVPTNEIVVDPANEVLYSTSKQLNVRSTWSTDSARLGALTKGQAAQVTGIVRQNGRDYGWYRIAFNGGTGYVSAKYLTATKPKNTKKTSFKVYSEGGDVKKITLRDDGVYADSEGRTYDAQGKGMYYCPMNGILYAKNRSVWTNGTSDGGYYGEGDPDDDPSDVEGDTQDPWAD